MGLVWDCRRGTPACDKQREKGARMKFLSLKCYCGHVPERIKAVGFTAAHQLVIHWRCEACQQFMYVLEDLASCWRHCPSSESQEEGMEAPDDAFLRSIGISSLGT